MEIVAWPAGRAAPISLGARPTTWRVLVVGQPAAIAVTKVAALGVAADQGTGPNWAAFCASRLQVVGVHAWY